MQIRAAIVALLLATGPTLAHDTWANGKSLPPWLKQYCCSIADVHRYSLRDIWHDKAGWHVPDLRHPIPDDKAQASEDEFAWAFFPANAVGAAEFPTVWCFFIPQGSV